MASDNPDRFVATVANARRPGRILIDYLRNQRGATTVAAYSTRAAGCGGVHTLALGRTPPPGIGPAYFAVETLPIRLASLAADP